MSVPYVLAILVSWIIESQLQPPMFRARKTNLTRLIPERTTAIGQTINSYLLSQTEMDDHAIHLLFAANRWECAYVPRVICHAFIV